MTINKTKAAKLVICLVAWVVITVLLYPKVEPIVEQSPVSYVSGSGKIPSTFLVSGILSVVVLMVLYSISIIMSWLWEWLNE